MNAKMNNTMGEQNDNNDDRGNGCFVRGFMDMGGLERRIGRRVRRVIIKSTAYQIKKMGDTMFAKFYINVRNILNDESGTTAFESFIITLMLLVVVVIAFTALMGFVDNSDAAGNLLGGALGIN